MPIHRGDVDGGALAWTEPQAQRLYTDVQQRNHTADEVQRVGGGEKVEERAAGIGGQVNSLRPQIQPGGVLAGEEQDAERRTRYPQPVEILAPSRFESATSQLQHGARSQQR